MRKSSYQKNTWINKGFSEQEAELKIKELKLKTGHSLESYIYRYGDDGELKHKEYKENLKNRKSPYKIDYWINKGFSEQEAELKIKEHKVKTSSSLESYITKYGKEEGTKRYSISKKSKFSHNLESYVTKYGKEEGTKRYNNKNNNHTIKMTIHHYRNRFPDDDISDEEIIIKSLESGNSEKLRNNKVQASYESLWFILPLYGFLLGIGTPSNNLFFGALGKSEFKFDNSSRKFDFVDTFNKIVVEYDGIYFHDQINAKKVDLEKDKITKENGYTMIRINHMSNLDELFLTIKQIKEKNEN